MTHPADRHPVRRVWAIVVVVGLVSGVVTGLLPWADPSPMQAWIAVAVCLTVAVTERWASLTVRIGDQTHNLTLSEIPLVAGLFLLPGLPTLLVLARIVGAVIGLQVLRRQEPYKTAFNVVHLWSEALLAIGAVTLIAPRSITDGPRVTLTVIAIAVVVTLFGAVAMVAAASATSGRPRPDLLSRGIREGFGPSVITCSAAVVALALAEASTALLWAPVAIIGALLVAYRAHVRLLESTDMQQKLLEFTRQITGEDDLRTTATQICDATRDLMDAPQVAMRIPSPHHGGPEWVGAGDIARMPHCLDVELAGSGHARCCPGGPTTTLFARIESLPDAWLAVTMDASTVDRHDRASVAMIANHAAVALANASRGQVLSEQARDARHHATHDTLTGLPNRAHLLATIREAIEEGRPFGLLLVDLNDFKEINDALGHAVGDTVLTEVTRRLAPAGRHARVVARLGGDEFAAVMTGGEVVCRELAQHLRDAIACPVSVGPYTIEVGSSIGVALFPGHGEDPVELLKNADLAMYEAKEAGAGTSVFGAAAGGRAMRHLAISSGFRAALQEGEIAVAFQPIVDLTTDSLVAVEALARWTHAELGPIGPDEFVRVAEQAGLITELTHHVLDLTLRWQRIWAAAGLDLRVSVNLSARSLLDAELPLHIARKLDEHDVSADRLTLELTESSVISDPARTMAVLHRLQALGVRLSIDDFGTGYSSLAYLRQLPADEVKIDKAFIQPMMEEGSAASLVSGILRLCHELGYHVVAEGIETPAIQSMLRRLGCERGQGFHIARPMAGDRILGWAAQHDAAHAIRL